MLWLLSNKVFVAAFLGLLVAMAALTSLRGGVPDDAVPDVAIVRHADVSEAPKAVDARTMVASYYASVLEGNPTASGEPYEPERYTAAHKSLPLGTELRVSYGGESVRVTVNDRGPYAPGHDLDLSLAAAREIGLVKLGTAPVRVATL